MIRGLHIVILILILLSCRKSRPQDSTNGGDGPPDTIAIKPQADPELSPTIGFFMDDWQEKNFTPPATYYPVEPPASAFYSVRIDRSKVITKIPRSIAGNNANIWMSDMINEIPLLDHIRSLHPHVIRFPGGSLSDIYFWNAPKGQPSPDVPAQLLHADGSPNTDGYWYGKNTESWTISVDKYYQMLNLTGNQGLITINYGYARYGTGLNPVASAAHLAADWVRYDNGRTKYWEIGNENFGNWEAGYRIYPAANQDGQPEIVNGLLYGQHFRVFADSMRKAAQETGKKIYIGAVTVESAPESWSSNTVRTWNSGLFSGAGSSPDFYVVHSYYTPYDKNSSAADILASPRQVTGAIMNYVKQSITNVGLPLKPVIMDEWNIFAIGSAQQVSHINGLHAVMVLGEALSNQFGLTARWDLANGWANGNDHGLFNIGDEPGGVPKWNPRPAFYHMYFFQKYLGDRLVESTPSTSELLSYASSFASGETAVAIVNTGTDTKDGRVYIYNFKTGARYYWYTITGGTDGGEFSRKVFVNSTGPSVISGGPLDYSTLAPRGAPAKNGVKVMVPGRSSVFVVVEKG